MANSRSDPPPIIVLAFVPRPDAAARLRRALDLILEAAAREDHPAVTDPDSSDPADQASPQGDRR